MTATLTTTIIQVRRIHFGGSGWRATETTADCSRFIGQRGAWPTLAEAVPAMKRWVAEGRDVRLSATAADMAEAKASLR